MNDHASAPAVNPTIDPGPNALTIKAIVVGLVLSFFLGLVAIHTMTIHASYLAIDFSTPGAIVLFFALVAIANPILHASGRRPAAAAALFAVAGVLLVLRLTTPFEYDTSADIATVLFWLVTVGLGVHFVLVWLGSTLALTGAELVTVYAMLICACAVCTIGYTTSVLPSVAGVFYYARPENRWDTIFHPHLPKWIAPEDPKAITHFFEGSPAGAGVDWGAWLGPLFYWTVLLAALCVLMIAVVSILRKQWVDRERLIYPMVHVPVAMAGTGEARSGRPFFRNPLVWVGFVVPMIFTSLTGLHAYFPNSPTISLVTATSIFQGSATLRFRLSFVMLGFAYLIKKDTALSLWVFALLALLLRGWFGYLGVSSTEKLLYGTNRSAMQSHVGMGAVLVLVIYGLWAARGHLKDVLRKALVGAPDVDDSEEILSYRAAVVAVVASLAVIVVWLVAAGIPLWAAGMLIAAALVLFLGLTRIVAEVGLANAVAPISPPCAVTSTVGATAFSSAQIACFAPSFLWAGALRVFPMAPAAHSMKLFSEVAGRKRRAFWALLLAILAAAAGSSWLLLRNCYAYGGINFGYPYLTAFARLPWQYTSYLATHPPGPNAAGMWSTAAGGAIMAVLVFLRNRFLWWPLAPIGFPLAGVWLMERLWLSIFLSWFVKTLMLKYGGLQGYTWLRPLFLGFILGQFAAAGLWLAIDSITGMTGNRVFWI